MRISPTLSVPLMILALALLPACSTMGEYGSETGFGLGLRGTLPLETVMSPGGEPAGGLVSRVDLVTSIHRAWPSDATWSELNADLHLPLFGIAADAAHAYAGAGVGLSHVDPDLGDSDTRVGGNLVGGIQFEGRAFNPFFEVRGNVGGTDQLRALAGIQLFGVWF